MKDLIVYLDGSKHDEARIAQAETLTAQHDGFLTGLYCNIIPEFVVAGEAGMAGGQIIVDLQTEAAKQGDMDFAALQKRFERLGALNELRRIDAFASQAGAQLASEARAADLFVTSRPYGEQAADAQMMEAVLFGSGHGCLFVPPLAKAKSFDTVFVAWRNTREAARAVREAIPILRKAKVAIVGMVIEGEAPEQEGREPGADVARYLGRHGIAVELRNITGWTNASDAILNEAKMAGADLIVMGGFGHSRFREWVLGGVTRDILSKAEVPVLMAH